MHGYTSTVSNDGLVAPDLIESRPEFLESSSVLIESSPKFVSHWISRPLCQVPWDQGTRRASDAPHQAHLPSTKFPNGLRIYFGAPDRALLKRVPGEPVDIIMGYFKPVMVYFGVEWPTICSYLAVQGSFKESYGSCK